MWLCKINNCNMTMGKQSKLYFSPIHNRFSCIVIVIIIAYVTYRSWRKRAKWGSVLTLACVLMKTFSVRWSCYFIWEGAVNICFSSFITTKHKTTAKPPKPCAQCPPPCRELSHSCSKWTTTKPRLSTADEPIFICI